MSVFVCVIERSGGTPNPRELERLAAPLAPYGAEISILCRGPVGIALRHHGGPGAHRRYGPLEDPETGRVVAVAGRFVPVAHERGGERQGGEGETSASRCEPAALAAAALARPPGRLAPFLAGVSGPFVLVAADPASGSLEIARDHLGSLKVYYALGRERLIAASEPAAILRHSTVSGDLDEISIARFLGFRFGLSERSFFLQVRELPPAHRLRVTADAVHTGRYWRFGPPPAVATGSPEEVGAEFRRRLARAIADEMAGLEPPQVGLSLSGGLDSTAIAALAPRHLQAFSWTFDELPEADERLRVEVVSRHLGLPVQPVPGDGLVPLAGDFAERFVTAGSPYVNPFAALKQRLYEVARAAGCERILVGDGGDAHFAARDLWLRDALASGRPWALRSFAATLRRAAGGDEAARRALGRVLSPAGLARRRRDPAPWLTAAARRLLPEETPSPILPAGGRDRHELVAGVKHSEIESEEQRLFALCGVERGNPFWSWPLLELTIHLPAYRAERDGRSKILTREAFRGLLPERVLEGGRAGLLGSFFLRGIELRREELREDVFRRPRSDWQRYVRREWLEPYLAAGGPIAFGHTILWRVIAYELWYRRRVREDHGSAATWGSEGRGRRDRGEEGGEVEAGRPADAEDGGAEDGEAEDGGAETGGARDLAGLVYGVRIRGRLPASFRPYLRTPAGEGNGAVDSLELRYRRIEELPEVEEIWATEEEAGPGGGRFALFRHPGGFGLTVSDQGRGLFYCDRRTIEIAWTAAGTGAPHSLFSHALPLWLETRGVPVLHGSVVATGGRAVGLVGASGVGKSLLAAELAGLGFVLLADDGLALRRDEAGGWRAFHGPPLLRLWPSALDRLGIAAGELPRVHPALAKRRLRLEEEDGGALAEAGGGSPATGVPLAALYLLERRPEPRSAGEERLEIRACPPREALVRLIEHSVAAAPAAVLGLSERRLELLAAVVEHVPVRHLRFPSGAGSAEQVRTAILRDLD